jgi:hypothetical protein
MDFGSTAKIGFVVVVVIVLAWVIYAKRNRPPGA